MADMSEPLAQAILLTAVKEGRAAELLACLFDGGMCTVDVVTRQLILVSGDATREWMDRMDRVNEETDDG